MLRRRSPEDFNETVNRLYPDATSPPPVETSPPKSATDEFGSSFPDPEDNLALRTRGSSYVQRGLDRAWKHLGVPHEARKDTVEKVLSERMPQEDMVDLVKQRTKDGVRQVQKRRGKSAPIVQGDNESVNSGDTSMSFPGPAPSFWADHPTKLAPTDPYEVFGAELVDHSSDEIGQRFIHFIFEYVYQQIQFRTAEVRQRATYVYGEVTKAYQRIIEEDHGGIYPDLYDTDPEVRRLLDLATAGLREPEPQKMYMHYTISQDRSGDRDSVSSGLLAVLGERSRNREAVLAALGERETRKEERFKNASLALLSRGG